MIDHLDMLALVVGYFTLTVGAVIAGLLAWWAAADRVRAHRYRRDQ